MSTTEKQLQNRLKSPIFWASIGAQVLSILVFTGTIDAGLSDAVNSVIGATCQALVLLGIFNDPTNKTGI